MAKITKKKKSKGAFIRKVSDADKDKTIAEAAKRLTAFLKARSGEITDFAFVARMEGKPFVHCHAGDHFRVIGLINWSASRMMQLNDILTEDTAENYLKRIELRQ